MPKILRARAAQDEQEEHQVKKLAESRQGLGFLNLQEHWWRLFRRDALAGQSLANPDEIEKATRVATAQLNAHAQPRVWGRPPRTPRHHWRLFCYRI
jgi:hypothetical protein